MLVLSVLSSNKIIPEHASDENYPIFGEPVQNPEVETPEHDADGNYLTPDSTAQQPEVEILPLRRLERAGHFPRLFHEIIH